QDRARRASRRRRACRPGLEVLEDRTVPSTISWTNRGSPTNDSDGFNDVFHSGAETARRVVDAALASWARAITNFNYVGGSNTYEIHVTMDSGGTRTGADATPSHFNNGKPDNGYMFIGRGGDTNGDGKGD